MFRATLSFLSIAIVVSLQAQSALAQQSFIARQGVMEFSGRLIARPLQPDAYASAREAQSARQEAHESVLPTTLRYVPETDEYVLQVPEGWNESTYSSYLMATGTFQYVEPDWIVYPLIVPNDAQYGSQWHLPKASFPTAWNHFRGTGTVVIAITDTGVRLDHQDLIGQLVSGANSATGTAIPQSSGGAVADINGHGTHVAGIAGATGNNSVGVSGANWNVKIMPVRVTNSSGGSSSIAALTAGARWAADNGARVVSTSYSGVDSASVGTTGTYIKATRNGVYCWAAGNDNVARTSDHIDVTIVGATANTTPDTKASFSAYGIPLDVFAPGVGILSTYYSSATSYTSISGTSMACPLAAGLAGLITGANPGLSAQQVENALYQSCTDLTALPGGPGNDNYWGWGRINAYAALQMAYAMKPFPATSFAVTTGTLQSGGLPQTASSDNTYLVVSTPPGATLIAKPRVIEFQGTTTNRQVGRLDFAIESAVTSGAGTQKIELFDYASNLWVAVDSRLLGTSDLPLNLTIPNPTRYVSSALVMRARVTLSGRISARTNWRFDQIGWFTLP